MDISTLQKKVAAFLKKYRYAVLVAIIGLVLMVVPIQSNKEVASQTAPPEQTLQISVGEQLAAILSQVKGAGRVEVMLTEATGEETIYQTDEDTSITEDSTSVKKDTVTITDAQRDQNGLVRQINPPKYLGAVIVCQGADSPTVKLAIVEAVSKVTGLGADRISVIKMK